MTVPDLAAIEVLTQAKERLFAHGWGQGAIASRSENGDNETNCLEQALTADGYLSQFIPYRATTDALLRSPLPLVRAAGYLKEVLGLGPTDLVWRWNDYGGRTASEVFDALDAAIMRAKEGSCSGS